MDLLIINGMAMPSPSSMNIGIQDIGKWERNARATMIGEIIATKTKLDLAWTYLSAEQTSHLLKSIRQTFYKVTYTDPEENAVKTITCYKGDRTVGIMDARNGIIRYKDVKFNTIER